MTESERLAIEYATLNANLRSQPRKLKGRSGVRTRTLIELPALGEALDITESAQRKPYERCLFSDDPHFRPRAAPIPQIIHADLNPGDLGLRPPAPPASGPPGPQKRPFSPLAPPNGRPSSPRARPGPQNSKPSLQTPRSYHPEALSHSLSADKYRRLDFLGYPVPEPFEPTQLAFFPEEANQIIQNGEENVEVNKNAEVNKNGEPPMPNPHGQLVTLSNDPEGLYINERWAALLEENERNLPSEKLSDILLTQTMLSLFPEREVCALFFQVTRVRAAYNRGALPCQQGVRPAIQSRRYAKYGNNIYATSPRGRPLQKLTNNDPIEPNSDLTVFSPEEEPPEV